MGTRSGAATRPHDDRRLSPAMRWTLVAVGGVAAAGLVAALALSLAPAGGSPSAATSATAAPISPTAAGPAPNATPVDGSEVEPPTTPDAPSDRLPPVSAPTPLVAGPLPASASAQGELVPGFPTVLGGPAPDADIIDSSVSSADTVMQVTLTARTDATREDVTAHYRSAWAGLGLADASGDAALAYTDPFSSLTLAFTDGSGTGTVYVIYATLRTE